MNDLQREQQKALRKAADQAKQGKIAMTQMWIDRAAQFGPVSPRSIARIQAELDDTLAFFSEVEEAANS